MTRTKRLTAFTSSYSQAAVVFPYILVAPAYFADKIQLGGMMQTASAFSSVQQSLSFFVSDLPLAGRMEFGRCASRRFRGSDRERRSADGRHARRSTSCRPDESKAIDLRQFLVKLPNGTPLVAADGFRIRSNEHVLVTGPSGAGKSTLFRAIAGIWPFGERRDRDPRQRHADDAAAAAVFSDRRAEGSDRLPREAGRVQFGSRRTGAHRRRPAATRPEAGGGSPLEPDALARRATAARASPARCCTRRNICSWTRRPPRSTRPRRRRSITCSPRSSRRPPSVSIGHRSTLEAFHDGHIVLDREGDHFAAHVQQPRKSPSITRQHYFRLVIAVRSAESLTMPVAPHQLEPKPLGLMAVVLPGMLALKALVSAAQLPLLRLVSE